MIEYDLLVLGAGPGGYTAAFRAADLNLKVGLIEYHLELGGVCLNAGCIPSKTYLHVAKIIEESRELHDYGVIFQAPQINVDKLATKKKSIVKRLNKGLLHLAKQRNIEVINGLAKFDSKNKIVCSCDDGLEEIFFKNALIATGSSPVEMRQFPTSEKILDSTGILKMEKIPERLLVIGGGIIGLEMANVYSELGSRVTLVESSECLLNGVDQDLVLPLEKRMRRRCEEIFKETIVSELVEKDGSIVAHLSGRDNPAKMAFDRVLVAIGRTPNTDKLNLNKVGVATDKNGFIVVDNQMRTKVDNIFAVGDVVGSPMLAHKASSQGKIVAEVISGENAFFEPAAIPSVVYTNPEVAWAGTDEHFARKLDIEYEVGSFPWSANGRALTSGADHGLTKLIFNKLDGRILGGGIVGPSAGELIGEITLAIEMGSTIEDISLSIHPHPTLAESVQMSSEVAARSVTDLYLGKESF